VKVPLLSALSLLAALVWTGAFAADPGPLAPLSVLLVAIGMLAMATVGMIGITVTGGRWAHRLALASLIATAVLAVARPIDVWWFAGFASTLLAAVALLSPAITKELRRLPPAGGPPWRAVLIPLLLIGIPFLLGLAAWSRPSLATVLVGLGAPLAALWYSRVLPGGLLAVRALWPGLAIGLAFTQSVGPAIVCLAAGVAVMVLAWHPSVGVAFHPPREIGTVHPIPPELTPSEVLDAAELDDRGRPRR
jgi:hypothetical protein